MQIVIDIPEEYYEECKEKAKTGIGSYTRIAEGTPLPKGHGRLGDLDELEKRMKIGYKIVADAPTIIEADEGGAE